MAENGAIYISGYNGLVGSVLIQELKYRNYKNIITTSFQSLDLRDQAAVDSFFKKEHPEWVILAAAHVGGIEENIKYPADFMMDNLLIEANTIKAAFENGAKKLIFICSSSIYPSAITNPKEEDIFKGPPDKSNEGYSMAKLFGLKLCEMYHKQYGVDYFSVVPCNIYGKNDRFSGDGAHVIPAMIRKFHQAKQKSEPEVSIWGTGKAMREFLYADDFADCCISLLEMDSWIGPCINIGSKEYITIGELAYLVKRVVGYEGKIIFEKERPEGQILRKMDTTKLDALHWKPKTSLEDGLEETYRFYLDNLDSLR